MLQGSYTVWMGGVIVAMLVLAVANLLLIGAAGASGEGADTEGRSHDTDRAIDASSADELRATAEDFLETAAEAREENRFEDAADAYGAALARYRVALDELDAGAPATRSDIESAIESTRGELETVRTLGDREEDLIETLKAAEQSFRVAIVAYTEGGQTLARIRFRQARDSFADAVALIDEADGDLFSAPVEVSINPDRELASTELSELPAIPESTAAVLADGGVDTITNLEGSEEPPWPPASVEALRDEDGVDEELITTLTLLSWMDDTDGQVFDSAGAVSRRRQQAAYGFDQSS